MRRAGAVRRWARRLAGLALIAPLGTCASQPVAPTAAPALCHIDTTLANNQPAHDRLYPAEYWFVLLVSGYRSSGEIARPAKDCRGLPTTLQHDACAPEPPRPDSSAPLRPGDLHIAIVGDARRLVWVETDHLLDGRAEGPVGLVDIDDKGLSVRALGVLRAYHDNVTLRLATLAGGTVLVAESERCDQLRTRGEDGHAPRACDRAVRVVPLLGDRFVDRPVSDEQGRCLDAGFFSERASGAAPDGARFQLEGAVAFSPDAVTIREQLSVSEPRDRGDAASASFVTKVEAERRVTLRGGGLVASEASLLSRWLARHADRAR
jgi:hypothetical protein